MQISHIFGDVELDPYHMEVIKGPMTQGIANNVPIVHEETELAFRQTIPTKGSGESRSTKLGSISDCRTQIGWRSLLWTPLGSSSPK
jgi:hypothetical protein